jgi:predicted glutamine amidotransferase
MCIAILNKKRILKKEVFLNSWDNNPDGFGMAYVEQGQIKIYKNLVNVEESYNEYLKVRKNTRLPVMLHFRISTSGKKDMENCHPFYVNQDLVFCHNGILGIKTTAEKNDTRTFNDIILKKLPSDFLKNPAIKNLVTLAIGSSKFVFLDSQGHYSILHENKGYWRKDTWYSNDTYKEKSYSFDYSSYWTTKDDKIIGFDKTTYPRTYPSNKEYNVKGRCDYCGNQFEQYELDRLDDGSMACFSCYQMLKENVSEQYGLDRTWDEGIHP